MGVNAMGDSEKERWDGFRDYEITWWSNYDFDPNTAREWREHGFEPDEATYLRKIGFAPAEACENLDREWFAARAWEDAREWEAEELEREREWSYYDFTYIEREKWERYSFAPIDAREWKDHGFDASEADKWRAVGICPHDAAVCADRTIKP
jgi:hypothetical protein